MSRHRAAGPQADTDPDDGLGMAATVLLVIAGTTLIILIGVAFGDGMGGP